MSSASENSMSDLEAENYTQPYPPKDTQTPDSLREELNIEVTEYPAGSRFIGPGDDVVISAEKLREYIKSSQSKLLEDLEAGKQRCVTIDEWNTHGVDVFEAVPLSTIKDIRKRREL